MTADFTVDALDLGTGAQVHYDPRLVPGGLVDDYLVAFDRAIASIFRADH